MDVLNLPYSDFKAVGDAGAFEGYAGVFGNVDLGGDVLERGSLKEVVTGKSGRVKVLYQHNQRDPIGLAEVKQDDHGLRFVGQLVLESASARSAYALMKAEVLDGMSFGYDVLPGGAEILKSGVRRLTGIKLWEVSPVTFGMNPLAGIASVKSKPATIREFEDVLRDVCMYSKAEAQAIAAKGFGALREQGEPVTLADVTAQLSAAIRNYST